MNLGIYLSSLSQQNQLQQISETINNGIATKKLSDASIFYDNVAYNPYNIKCGIFNSTDLWNFSGTLITTSLSTTMSAMKIVNNIDMYYYYGLEDKISPLSLINILNKGRVRLIAKTDNDNQDLYRKTRTKALYVCENFIDIIDRIV